MREKMETIFIKNNRTIKRINDGHLWLFSNELIELPNIHPGTIVNVSDKSGKSYGVGFYNKNSLISVRLLNSSNFNKEILNQRIANAFISRKNIFPLENSFRLVYGESDSLPGLIIDKYSDYFSVQLLSFGMELLKNEIAASLLEIFPQTKGIIIRNDSYWRKIEGLDEKDEIIFGTLPEEIEISENGIIYRISLTSGQKTGYFFDQRLNRNFLQSISKDKTVLDLFTNQGGFALNAARGNAKNVIGIDISSSVITMARSNTLLNEFRNINFFEFDVFDYLKNQISENHKYDLIICDPPAFAKNKKSIKNALIAYRRVNKLAMKCLNNNGILLTSSCSQHIDDSSFNKEIQKAANEVHKKLIQIYQGIQSPDHPILPSMNETKYLKFLGFIVRDLKL